MNSLENFPVNHEKISLEEDPFPDLRNINDRFSERYDLSSTSAIDDTAVIYHANDFGSEKLSQGKVAIKIFTNDDISKAAMRNSLEIELSKEIDHPNIIKSIDDGVVLLPKAGEYKPYRYMVTPLASEGDLTSFSRRKVSGLNTNLFQDLFADAAQGLSELHARGLVHRNVRPRNVLVDKDENGQFVARIAGLNVIAPENGKVEQAPILEDVHMEKVVERIMKLENKNQPVGSPEYIAPEQKRGEVHPRSDVFSIGKVAVRVLGIGNHMNNGFHTNDVGETYLDLSPEEIAAQDEIPSKIGQMISLALQADPGKRPKARELAQAALA